MLINSKNRFLAAYHYIRPFKITFNSDFMRPEGTSFCKVIFATCGFKKNSFPFHSCFPPTPVKCHVPERNAATYFLCRTGLEQRRICNVSWPLLQSSFEGIQRTTSSAHGWAKRLNPTTTIKIQINNSVVGVMGDFDLWFHICIFFFRDSFCIVCFFFHSIIIPQPLVIAGRRL